MDRPLILVADDDPGVRRMFGELLDLLGYSMLSARDGQSALAALSPKVDLLILDLVMPSMDGFDLLEQIRSLDVYRDLPVIVISGLDSRDRRVEAVRTGATDFLMKPVDPVEMEARIRTLLSLKKTQDHLRTQQEQLERIVEQKTESLRLALQELRDANRREWHARMETVQRLALAAEFRDADTARHLYRMQHYCELLAKRAGLSDHLVETISHASILHDVGKLAIRREVLNKPGELTSEERKHVESHTLIGAEMLAEADSELLQEAEQIARTHHEHWDGSGYPAGLKGADIPLGGRICSIVDVFDALTTQRAYKEACSVERAREMMEEKRGLQFDPDLLDIFFSHMEEVREISRRTPEETPPG